MICIDLKCRSLSNLSNHFRIQFFRSLAVHISPSERVRDLETLSSAEVKSIRDEACIGWKDEGKCRSGLPFYRWTFTELATCRAEKFWYRCTLSNRVKDVVKDVVKVDKRTGKDQGESERKGWSCGHCRSLQLTQLRRFCLRCASAFALREVGRLGDATGRHAQENMSHSKSFS